MLESVLPGVQHLQNIHPMVVHFPIPFITGAAFLYILAWILGSQGVSIAAFGLLVLGALSAAVAVGTGLYAEPGVMVSRSVREHLLDVHKRLMLATVALSGFAAFWAMAARPFPTRGRLLFVLVTLLAVAVMALGADYGARMVYDYNAGGSACPQPIEFTK